MTSTKQVRFIDYQSQFRKIERDIMAIIEQTLKAGDVMLRSQLSDFEANLAKFVGVESGVGLNSCTDALFLSLKALGIGPKDEVITVSHTFVATVAAIFHTGARPILVDVLDDGSMDPDALSEAISSRTKAIIPVHVNGFLCEMDKIMAVADRAGIPVIEDSAQALGASYKGVFGGAWGLAGTFSFYPAKQLGAYGDGGAVTTKRAAFADKLKVLRNHGRTPDGDIACFSYNSRLDNLQAAILDYKLKLVPQWIVERRIIAEKYHQGLIEIEQLSLPTAPSAETDRYCSFQNFELCVENRDELLNHLRSKGVEIILPWGGRAVHQFPKLELESFNSKLPRTNDRFAKIMTLPMHNELTESDVAYVIEQVRNFYAR